MQKRILIIDDESNMQHMLNALLSKQGYVVDAAGNGSEGLDWISRYQYDFILCDLKMPVMDGMEFLHQAQLRNCAATIIMMSAYGTVDQAIETVKNGAYDYISKPFKLDEILLVLRKAEERERLRHENVQLRAHLDAIDGRSSFGGMIGKSKSMQDIFALAAKVAPHQTTVLITGESGTGKELIARGIHLAGRGKAAPFVPINCGGIPENLLESEFFGYVRGAFTGAEKEKTGLFEAANGGTLFLDEIAELPFELQSKLLRVLQEREVRRIGATKGCKVDVRVLAATNKDLGELVKQGKFREDLYFRLNVLNIHIPPLSNRKEDIPLLCQHLIDKLAVRSGMRARGIDPAALDLLMQYHWPGNVRELENILERALILTDKEVILPEHLPAQFEAKPGTRRISDILGTFSLKEGKRIMEKRLISRALEETGWNKRKAAVLLELSYPALLSKIKEYEIDHFIKNQKSQSRIA